MATAEYIQKKKSKGLCISYGCHEPSFPGYVECARHRKMSRIREIRYEQKNKEKNRVKSKGGREKRKKEGRCIRCSCELNPDVDEGYAKCMNCRQGLPGGYYEAIPKIYAL